MTHLNFLVIAALPLLSLSLSLQAQEDKVASENNGLMVRQQGELAGFLPLEVSNKRVPATYLGQTLGENRGVILLLHDQADNLDSHVISALRHGLPAYGWDTMTLALNQAELRTRYIQQSALETELKEPDTDTVLSEMVVTDTAAVLPKDEKLDEPEDKPTTIALNAERIDTALAYLQAQGAQKIIVLGHGKSGELALETVLATALPVVAVVMVSTGELNANDSAQINLPILEIYGSRHSPAIIKAINQRHLKHKTQEISPYDVRVLYGADRHFSGMHSQLIKQIHGWLHHQLIKSETF